MEQTDIIIARPRDSSCKMPPANIALHKERPGRADQRLRGIFSLRLNGPRRIGDLGSTKKLAHKVRPLPWQRMRRAGERVKGGFQPADEEMDADTHRKLPMWL